jgi:hypothetical protein
MKRRYFIKIASFTAASFPFLSFAKITSSPEEGSSAVLETDSLFDLFANPQNIHRPFVRWWWNGDRVSGREALRELDLMKDAGIGGVEINPIKWNENADPIGIKELTWGSEEWLDVVEIAVKGAKERGMVCDMIVGSGWPFGGEFVPRNEQSQIIMLGTKNLDGGKRYVFACSELVEGVTPPSNYKNKQSELFMLRLAPANMDEFTTGIDLSSQLKNDNIEIVVPDGSHILYYLVKITGFQSVIQGALGANGPVINHYEKAAVENYLNRFSDILSSKLGALSQYFRAFFTDSIELEGANWCSDMFEEFKIRRGYELGGYFPYILFKVGEMGNAVKEVYGSSFSPEVKAMLNRVHYDFELTRTELFQERFIKTFTGWCTKHGVRSRMQAYGMDCHPLEASMLLDIPECETWIWVPQIEEFGEGGSGRNYTMINKFVSSAGHLSGKQLISCEEMTNTGQIFSTTLERIKVTGDQSNLSGVTHSILHGFNYSPLETPFPGWLRYGSFFNERNTWWPYFRLWSDYKSRLSAVFQNSVMQADIAVLHPLADLASKFGFQRDPFPLVSYPPYVHQVWEAIHQNGNGCDYVSENILQQASYADGRMHFGTRSYLCLLLIEVETMQPKTAKAIAQFAKAGGKIIFVGKTAHFSSGLEGYMRKSKSIKNGCDRILKKYPSNTALVDAPGKDLLDWYRQIQQRFALTPYIQIDKPVYHTSQLYYKSGDKDIFFFTNYSGQKEQSFRVNAKNSKTAWLWDAETGKRYLYPVEGDGFLELFLGPCESKIIVFDKKGEGEEYKRLDRSSLKESVLPGPWQLNLSHVNDTVIKITLEKLTDLKKMEGLVDFSGTIMYKTKLSIPEPGLKTFLDLGEIHDVSELEINGQFIGSRWYGYHLYDISTAVRTGENYISIKIVTTMGAYTKSLKNNKAAQEWSGEALFGPTGLEGPVKILTGIS